MNKPLENTESLTHTLLSTHSIDQIHTDITAKITSAGFSLVHLFDFYELMAQKGQPIQRKVFVYEICNAKLASKMLTSFPHFSAFMPCRISVYENDEGGCSISTPNMNPAINSLPNTEEIYEMIVKTNESLHSLLKNIAN